MEECPALQEWLAKRDKWLSADVQNEILEIMAHEVLRSLVRDIKSSPFFSLMADGTTDVTGDEQLSICIRYVDKSLDIHEVCVGFSCISKGNASTIKETIFDVMVRLGLDKEFLRGHCFDGAAARAGRLNGVQKLITDDQPKSIFVHCSNHALDLVIQELAKQCNIISDSLLLVKEVSKAIMESAKRKNIYNNIVIEPCSIESSSEGQAAFPMPKKLRTICPTRWCVRAAALRRFLDNYSRVRQTLKIMLKDDGISITDDRKAALRGYLKKMETFPTVVALKIALLTCEPAEQLAKALQKHTYTATGAKQSAQSLYDTYSAMGDADFERLWAETEELDAKFNLDLEIPETRQRAPPRRLGEVGGRAAPVRLTVKQKLHKDYVAVLDWSKSELQRRFDQPGMAQLIQLEEVLFAGGPRQPDNLQNALGVHATDFNVEKLAVQLKIADSTFGPVKSLQEYAQKLKSSPAVMREELLHEVTRLVTLLLTVPATSTSCERSFSALKRLKTYLRSTMLQKRLTHLLLLHVHKERCIQLSREEILKEFASRTSERRKVFGVVHVTPR